MGARIAFVVNALTGPELSGGKSDSARIYAVLIDGSLGKCDPGRSPAPIHQCDSQVSFHTHLDNVLSSVTPDDQMVIYFTGHGTYKNGIYCLEFGHTAKNYLPFDNILTVLQTRSISRALIIIDACHSGAATEKGRKSSEPTYSPQPEQLPRGIAIVSSCRATEVSAELQDGSASVFTSLLCQGIQSGLDGKPTEGGVITITDICSYINAKIGSENAFQGYVQHPAYRVDGGGGPIWLAYNKSGDSRTSQPAPIPSITTLEQLRFAYEKTASSRWPCDGVELSDLNSARVRTFAERVAPGLREVEDDVRLADKLGLISTIPVGGISKTAQCSCAVLL